MPRILTTVLASATLVASLGLTGVGSASASGWCDNAKGLVKTSGGSYLKLPHNLASNSLTCTLAEGSSGPGVTALQQALRLCNLHVDIAADGEFGPRTEDALEAAQRAGGTDDDGIYGPNTRDALEWPLFLPDGGRISCWEY